MVLLPCYNRQTRAAELVINNDWMKEKLNMIEYNADRLAVIVCK